MSSFTGIPLATRDVGQPTNACIAVS